MYLDNRSISILKEIISNPNISSKDLGLKKNISRRQIKYSVEKINMWLLENNYQEIKRLNNGKFLISQELAEFYSRGVNIPISNYIPSEKERALLILFILLTQNDLSLFHFSDALKVSNVTVLNDMKVAQRIIKRYGLELIYSRVGGYRLVGREWSQRNCLHDIILKIKDIYGGLSLIQDFTNLREERINNIFIRLEKIEKELNIQFTDEKMQILPYAIGIIFERVKRGNVIEFDFQIKYEQLSETKEYKATEQLVKSEGDLPEIERLYIALQLLSANVFSGNTLTVHEIPQLKNALYETLCQFERNAFVQLKNKDHLVERLMLHLKPAYYRIKYNLTSSNPSVNSLNGTFIGLDHMVKQSLGPLERFIRAKIPDQERYYITIFIGSHLFDTTEILNKRKKAIIVCPNGVTVSNLLKNTLNTLFPEFLFYPNMSVRDFYNTEQIDVDIVFSPVPVKTEKDLFITEHLLSEDDKQKLKQRVMKRIYGVDNSGVSMTRLIEVIERSATVNKRDELIRNLKRYFHSLDDRECFSPKDESPNLADLITEETILIRDKVKDWQEAIQIASRPLLLNESIVENYVERMIAAHNYEKPYMILGKNMAIPHAEPKSGVNRLGMSLLVVKNGVKFSENLVIKFVVVIAPTDTDQHVKAIYQLSNLSSNDNVLSAILENPTMEVIINSLRDSQFNQTLSI